jgi:hypothetical protein
VPVLSASKRRQAAALHIASRGRTGATDRGRSLGLQLVAGMSHSGLLMAPQAMRAGLPGAPPSEA